MNISEELYQLMRRALSDELDDRAGGKGAPPEPEMERFAEVAARFSVSISWLEAKVKTGELAQFGKGRERRLRPADVRALIRRRGIGAVPSPAEKADEIMQRLPRRKA